MWGAIRHSHPKSPNLEFRIVCAAPTPAARSVARPCVRCDPCVDGRPRRVERSRFGWRMCASPPQRATRNAQPQGHVGKRNAGATQPQTNGKAEKPKRRARSNCVSQFCGLRFYIFSRVRVLLFSSHEHDTRVSCHVIPHTYCTALINVNSWLLVHAHPQIQQNVKCCKCTRT